MLTKRHCRLRKSSSVHPAGYLLLIHLMEKHSIRWRKQGINSWKYKCLMPIQLIKKILQRGWRHIRFIIRMILCRCISSYCLTVWKNLIYRSTKDLRHRTAAAQCNAQPSPTAFTVSSQYSCKGACLCFPSVLSSMPISVLISKKCCSSLLPKHHLPSSAQPWVEHIFSCLEKSG